MATRLKLQQGVFNNFCSVYLKISKDLFKIIFLRSGGNVASKADPHGELKGRNVLTLVGTDPEQIKAEFKLTDEELNRFAVFIL